jgi:polyphosphate kinase
VHIGTGNYNAATAALYTDLGLLSADEDLGADVNDLFNELSGSSRPPESAFRRLLVAPIHLLPRFLALIDREAEHARAGRGGQIRAKLNGLSDGEIIVALYRAAQAGVDIHLSIRGLCRLRPGVPGLSERIRVVSVLGRFLEHARIFCFANGGAPEYYIGSADWRPRNLRRRVEVVAPVRHLTGQRRLDQILAADLEHPTAWELHADGSYERRAAPQQ